MEMRPYTSIKANILLNVSEISCYLKKKTFETNGSPRHLHIVSNFHTWSSRFVYKLKTIYSSKMVIEYSLPRISLISSYILTNKALILSIFWKRWSLDFPAIFNARGRKDRLLRSFLKLASFECNILITTQT